MTFHLIDKLLFVLVSTTKFVGSENKFPLILGRLRGCNTSGITGSKETWFILLRVFFFCSVNGIHIFAH